MLLTADVRSRDIGPWQHLGRIEHAQLEAAHQRIAQVFVEVRLLDHSFLQTLSQRHEHLATLQVGTVEHGINRSAERTVVCLVLSFIIEIVDGVAVGEHNSIVAPLVAQDVNEQTVAGTTGLALKTLVGTHHLADIGFLDQCLEGWQIGLPQVTVRRFHIHRVAQGLWTTVYGIVLGTGVGLEILVVVALHAQDGLHAQYGIHVGVLTAGLLTTSPARVAENVNVRTPERQLRIARIVGHALWHVEQLGVVVVGAVPVGTGLVADLRENIIDQLRIKGCRHTDGLWIDGVATLAYTVTSLAPPVVTGDAESVY